jgi:predicted amidophosphoribosyltransferase
VHALNYKGYLCVVEKAVAPLMAGLVGGGFDAVVAVSLHRPRLAKRGFNQAELMAGGVAKRISAPVLDKLRVVRRTRDQVELSVGARRSPVAGVFASRGPAAGRVLLVDDLFTTGGHPERVRRCPSESGRGRDPRPDPVPDLLAFSYQSGLEADC